MPQNNIIPVRCPHCTHLEHYAESFLAGQDWVVECLACGELLSVGEDIVVVEDPDES